MPIKQIRRKQTILINNGNKFNSYKLDYTTIYNFSDLAVASFVAFNGAQMFSVSLASHICQVKYRNRAPLTSSGHRAQRTSGNNLKHSGESIQCERHITNRNNNKKTQAFQHHYTMKINCLDNKKFLIKDKCSTHTTYIFNTYFV